MREFKYVALATFTLSIFANPSALADTQWDYASVHEESPGSVGAYFFTNSQGQSGASFQLIPQA